MQTTLMKDSSVGDEWIKRMIADNPVQWVLDKDGNRTANILTGPVRLNWAFLVKQRRAKDKKTGEEYDAGYETQTLFPPGVDFSAIMEAYNAQLQMDCRDYIDPQTGQTPGLHSPFRDQAEKAYGGKNTKGYTPGCIFMTCSNSKYAPLVVDARMNPIVDESKIYPGVWAILSINAYSYGIKTQQAKKGVKFGIVSVMIIADDDKLDSGFATDPRAQFSGVKNVMPPSVQPSTMFGMGGQPAPMMPNTNAAFVTPAMPAMPQAPMSPVAGSAAVPPMMPPAQPIMPTMPAPAMPQPQQTFAPPAAAQQVKACWHCHNTIPANAVTCPYCTAQQQA